MLGAFVVSCKEDGNYKPKQCLGSTGYCWCVNTVTGIEVRGSRKGPGQGTVTCGMFNTFIYKKLEFQDLPYPYSVRGVGMRL